MQNIRRSFLIILIILITSIISTVLLISGCNKTETVSIEYVPTTGETVIITTPFYVQDYTTLTNEVFPYIKRTYEVFPNEIYFGDTIYLVRYDTNIADHTMPGFSDIGARRILVINPSAMLTSDTLRSQYSWKGELPSSSPRYTSFEIGTRDLIPGEKRLGSRSYLEFPPLEDWDAPFWQEVRENMVPEGVKCTLKIVIWRALKEDSQDIFISLDILIKPRPESEMALLEKWYKNTPEELFPEVRGHSKVPRNRNLQSSGRSNIRIGLFRYDPWMFIRLGNRKPSDPNNPTTLNGWRELEASLVPSTMRDEVRLVRLQLEYYAARAGEDSAQAKKYLLTWLQSLPAPQRVVMTASLMYNSSRFIGTTLQSRNQELIRAIQNMPD